MDLKRISKKNLSIDTLLVLFISLVFLYDYFIGYLSYLDEILAVLCLGSWIFIKKIKLLRTEYLILFLLLFVLIVGVASNFFTYKKIALQSIFLDTLSFYKAFIVYFGVRIYFKNISISDILPGLKKIAIYGFIILLVFLIIDISLWIFPRTFRFGLPAFELFFSHSSRLSFAFSFIFIVLYPYYIKKWKPILIFILLAGLITLRVKYMGFLLISLIFIFNKRLIFGIKKGFIYAFLIMVPIVLFFVFKDWIMYYFSEGRITTGWSRGILLRYSFIISHDFFPLGTGFGSFASYFSGQDYSWVYGYYNLDNVWGISEKNHHFLADQYWPMVLGQFGVFGFLAMCGVIVAYITILISKIKSTVNKFKKDTIIAGLLGIILLLIDSTSDAIFSQNRGVVIFIFIALIVNDYTKSINSSDKPINLVKNENITNK